jgi:hypothetical protein
MIVFDLKCGGQHVFEAWFGSSDDYRAQLARGLVACPLCGDTAVEKAVMAPNIPAKGNRRTTAVAPIAPTGAPSEPVASPETAKAILAALAKAQAVALESSQWVGRDFASRARAMHDGDLPHATIHGEATAHEAKALIEEGVSVAPLPFPVVPPSQRN